MKRTKFLHCLPCAAPENADSEVITAVSQILEADGEQAAEISLFLEGKLKARYFADKETYSTWVNGTWTGCKFGNVLRICVDQPVLKNDYYYCEPKMEWASEEDRHRVYDFLDTYSIDSYETVVSSTKRENAYIRKQRRINEMMAEVPCVPEEAEAWVENEFFREISCSSGKKRTARHSTVQPADMPVGRKRAGSMEKRLHARNAKLR